MKICQYGCGKEAKYQLKNGKWCCSYSYAVCVGKRVIKSLSISEANRIVKNKNLLNSQQNIKRIFTVAGLVSLVVGTNFLLA